MAKSNGLSDGERSMLAKRRLAGEQISDLVGLGGLTKAQLTRELKSQKTRDVMAKEQYYYDGVVARMRLQMHMSGEQTVTKMLNHRDGDDRNLSFQASKFIIESILPKREHHLSEVHHYVEGQVEVVAELVDALKGAKQITATVDGRPSYADNVLIGTEGIETIEPEAGTTECVPGPNGSGTQLEKDPDGKPEPPPTSN